MRGIAERGAGDHDRGLKRPFARHTFVFSLTYFFARPMRRPEAGVETSAAINRGIFKKETYPSKREGVGAFWNAFYFMHSLWE